MIPVSTASESGPLSVVSCSCDAFYQKVWRGKEAELIQSDKTKFSAVQLINKRWKLLVEKTVVLKNCVLF